MGRRTGFLLFTSAGLRLGGIPSRTASVIAAGMISDGINADDYDIRKSQRDRYASRREYGCWRRRRYRQRLSGHEPQQSLVRDKVGRHQLSDRTCSTMSDVALNDSSSLGLQLKTVGLHASGLLG